MSILPAASQDTATETFAVCDQNRSGFNKDVNLGKRAFGAGDYSVFTDPLLNPSNGNKVGKGVGRLTLVRAVGQQDGIFILDATHVFGRGKVSTYGSGRFSQLRTGVTFPVIGGTGKYRAVRGTMTGTAGRCRGKSGIRITFRLRLQ